MTDRPKIGPTGEFGFGGPVDQNDRGGIHVGFSVLPHYRQCMMNFGTPIETLTTRAADMLVTIGQMRQKVIETWGEMPYIKEQLPIRVTVVHGNLIELRMPVTVETLVCNPEVILALCEVVQDRTREAGLDKPVN